MGMSNATPIKLFPVDSYDMKSMPFKFGNDIFIIFEMPRSSLQRPIDKNNISLLFRPSVIRGPWAIADGLNWRRKSTLSGTPALGEKINLQRSE